jgi:hypothetical protein
MEGTHTGTDTTLAPAAPAAAGPSPVATSLLFDDLEVAAPAPSAHAPTATAHGPTARAADDLLLDFGTSAGRGASGGTATAMTGARGTSSMDELLSLTTTGAYTTPPMLPTGPQWHPPHPAPVPAGAPATWRSNMPATTTPLPGYPPVAYPSALAGYPAPPAAQRPPASTTTGTGLPSLAVDPALVGRGRDAPNYNLPADRRTSGAGPTASGGSSGSFGFVGEKRDAFAFVQEEIRRK